MPAKKDGRGKHWVEMETLIPGTPEQVWQAMCTGPGMSTWFTPATVEERVGGALSFEMGEGATSKGIVTAWEPPRLFGYVEQDWMPGAPPVATELTITGRGDGKCVVRMVHSLFASTDDWDDQLESFESGWSGFFEVLKLYLTHFAGRKARPFSAMRPGRGDTLSLWKRLVVATGFDGASVGERRTSTSGPEPLDGIVERTLQDERFRYVIVRLSTPFDGISCFGTYVKDEGSTAASVWTWVYGDDAAAVAAAHEPKWRQWLEKIAAG
jgi:uncharacterized protein YndB with AHSA1/START domain